MTSTDSAWRLLIEKATGQNGRIVHQTFCCSGAKNRREIRRPRPRDPTPYPASLGMRCTHQPKRRVTGRLKPQPLLMSKSRIVFGYVRELKGRAAALRQAAWPRSRENRRG